MRKTKIICTLGPSTDKDGVLEELIKEETNNQLSFFKESDGFSLDNEEMLKTIDQIIDKLIDIYKEYPDEFRILMLDSKLNASLLDWFSKLIYNLITGHFLSFFLNI